MSSAVLAVAALVPGASFSQDLKPEEIYARLLPSVLTLKVVNTRGERFTGSAFLALGDGLAVTSWHVLFDAAEATALFADGQKTQVLGVVDKDETRDLALVKLDTRGRPLAKLAATRPRVGARLYVIGAPKGYAFSIADGLLSQVATIAGAPQFQISCPLSTGNSGGPLVNEHGEVVGVASWSKIDAQNVNFAVPIESLSFLDPRKPAIPCKALAAGKNSRAGTPLSVSPARTPDRTATGHDLEAFRDFLRASAGHKITLSVQGPQKPEVFTFVVPE